MGNPASASGAPSPDQDIVDRYYFRIPSKYRASWPGTILHLDDLVEFETEGAKRGLTCDCGGQKTYGVISKETCAHWCGSQGKV